MQELDISDLSDILAIGVILIETHDLLTYKLIGDSDRFIHSNG